MATDNSAKADESHGDGFRVFKPVHPGDTVEGIVIDLDRRETKFPKPGEDPMVMYVKVRQADGAEVGIYANQAQLKRELEQRFWAGVLDIDKPLKVVFNEERKTKAGGTVKLFTVEPAVPSDFKRKVFAAKMAGSKGAPAIRQPGEDKEEQLSALDTMG